MRWIEHKLKKPRVNQKVWYFWPGCGTKDHGCHGGVWRGKYFGEEAWGSCYGGKGGFLGGDEVTHWQPDDGRPEPKPPVGWKGYDTWSKVKARR